MPRFMPTESRSRCWTSSSGSAGASSSGTRTGTHRGTLSPSAPAISAQITSATSARGPCPAPQNLTTYIPRSSASMRPGRDPPSRRGVT